MNSLRETGVYDGAHILNPRSVLVKVNRLL
jgi:hypothetical protein